MELLQFLQLFYMSVDLGRTFTFTSEFLNPTLNNFLLPSHKCLKSLNPTGFS
ncbi:hypothetical protein EXN66_Car005578 [Channa argus]|uniref:Uncharacterized protein n=1 Tax=Channa argus TaxID=215402 RepID=A0A6G1PIR8_CHAAH|nr:hypothetical protein EXN66_Car005578 [Channa argus]